MFKTNQVESSDKVKIEIELNFTRWLEENGKHGQGHAGKSIAAYVSDIRQFADWFEAQSGESFSPAGITSTDLRSYFHHSIDIQQVASSTWNRRRASLATFFQFCIVIGLVAHNPFQGVPRMEQCPTSPRSLIRADYLHFMRKVEQAVNSSSTEKQRILAIRNRAMVALMVGAGLREGEVCALAHDDLLLTERKGQISIRDGKGHKSGKAYLGVEGRMALTEWLKVSKGNLLFDGITPRQVQRIVAEIGFRAGLRVTPHMLRHTFVYNVVQTENMATAQMLARHARMDQTGRYAMPHEEDLQAAVEKLAY